MSKWSRFKEKWQGCRDCDLCEYRRKIVLARGKLPCQVLFIGEAPGPSENLIGSPFVGPAGILQDDMIKDAGLDNLRLAFANLLCCIPLLDEEGNEVKKAVDPPSWAVEACATRLQEFVRIANPEFVVRVGKAATKWVPKVLDKIHPHVDIKHPAAILRADVTQKGLMIQDTVATLREVGEDW